MAASLWGDVQGALHLAGGGLPQLSEIRTEHQDWVRDGLRLRRFAGGCCWAWGCRCFGDGG
jgi:hypothetical protein